MVEGERKHIIKTQKNIHSRLAFGLPVVLFAVAVTAAFGQTKMPTPEQIMEKVTIRRPYKIGEEAEVVLPIGQAVQFDCADNPYWVREYILYAATTNMIWMCSLDTDGDQMDTGGALLRQSQGWLQQVADTLCLAIMKWDLQGQNLRLHFCLSTDKEQNQTEWDSVRTRKTKMAWGMKNLKLFAPQKLPETERLAGFIRLWSEVKYNFAFFDHVPEVDWDKVLVEYLPKVQQAETQDEYFCVLTRCLALLHDGHTGVQLSGGALPHPGYEGYGLPLEVRPLSGKRAIIVRTVPVADIRSPKRKEELLNAALKPGEELTHINGRPVEEILEKDLYPYICASTPQSKDVKACDWLLLGAYGSQAVLRIKDLDGTEREVTLTRGTYSTKQPANNFASRELADGILYVNLPDFASKAVVRNFEKIFPQVQKAKGLILDVRLNDGGNSGNGNAIISMLIGKPIKNSRWKTREYMPAFRAWGEKEQWHEEENNPIEPGRKDPFLGPVVVLTGPETFSAAEDFVVVLHANKRVTVLGERTAGSTGQPLNIYLPGGGVARVCTKHDQYPDGREFVGVGVIPDVEVHPTATDIATDRDVVLEKAVDFLKAGTGREPSANVHTPKQ